MKTALLRAAAAACLALALIACSDRVAGGDATETGNAIAVRLHEKGGGPAAGAVVSLVPSAYNPVTGGALPESLTRAADANGYILFRGLAAGRYNVQALLAASGRRVLVTGVLSDSAGPAAVDDTVRTPGAVSVPLPESADSGEGYVYVPGTTFELRFDAEARRAGRVLLDSLPPGVIPGIYYTKGESASPQVPLASDLAVGEGATVKAPVLFGWAHALRLAMNTSGGWVDIPADAPVTDFPLLVRLSRPGFDFTEALPDGRDLRFTSAAGEVLAHEIEHWDAAAGQAAIWVRVDTIRGNSAAQHIEMRWGNPGAKAPAPRPVFDTAAGFAGVWHLAEEAADTAANNLYRDATQGGSHGNDRIRSTDQAGLIGWGHGFTAGDYVRASQPSERLRTRNAFTVSAWFRTSGPATDSGGELVSAGDNYGLRVTQAGELHAWFFPPTQPAGQSRPWYSSDTQGAALLDGAWHLGAAVHDGATLAVYVDGALSMSRPAPGPVDFKFPLNVTLGKHGEGNRPNFEFVGGLDEARIHSRAVTAAWIKLCHENQKPGSAFPAPVP